MLSLQRCVTSSQICDFNIPEDLQRKCQNTALRKSKQTNKQKKKTQSSSLGSWVTFMKSQSLLLFMYAYATCHKGFYIQVQYCAKGTCKEKIILKIMDLNVSS